MQFVATAPVFVAPPRRTVVAATAAGVAAPARDEAGVSFIPTLNCNIDNVALHASTPRVASSQAQRQPLPPAFNWSARDQARARSKQLHAGADALDWYAQLAPQQLSCGSCWAFAVATALADVARVATNRMLPPGSATYLLGCGNVMQVARGSSANPCGGGQIAQGVALAISRGLQSWPASDYAWAEQLAPPTQSSPGEAATMTMCQPGPDGGHLLPTASCLLGPDGCAAPYGDLLGSASGAPAAAPADEMDTVRQMRRYIEAHIHEPGRDPSAGGADALKNAGVPPGTSFGPSARDCRIFARSAALLRGFDRVAYSLYDHGPAVATYLVPEEFSFLWAALGQHGDGSQVWAETRNVYMHTLQADLYRPQLTPEQADAARRLRQAAKSAWDRSTGSVYSPEGGEVALNQIIGGGHAVVVTGFALRDLWSSPGPGRWRIRPGKKLRAVIKGAFGAEHQDKVPCYVVRNSWGETGPPPVDQHRGFWWMAASGAYEMERELGGGGGTRQVEVNTLTGFDEPVMEQLGGVIQVIADGEKTARTLGAGGSVVAAGDPMAAARAQLERLRDRVADNSCGCPVDKIEAVGDPPEEATAAGAAVAASGGVAAACPACPACPMLTPAGWCFFGLAMGILVVLLVWASVRAAALRRRPLRGR